MAKIEGEKKSKMSQKSVISVIGVFFGLLSCLSALPASAASFYFSPSSGSYNIGKSFAVTIYASSKAEAANAFQGTVTFPADKLQITSLSKAGSALTMWIQEPVFSNGKGTAQFEGIVLNPGYTGGGARILTINFKVKAAGAANVALSSASILANDGVGTNILDGLGSAKFTLNVAPTGNEAAESTTGAASAGAPLAPEIKSTTHQSAEVWYNNNAPHIFWQVASTVTKSSFAFTKDVTTDPGTASKTLTSSKDYVDIADGEWYFHLRLGNQKGWSGTSHRKFKIDTHAPENLKVTFVGEMSFKPSLYVTASDTLSGVDRYELAIGDTNLAGIKPADISESKPYVLPVQESGTHNLVVKAYDAAGNSTVSTVQFTILPLEAPSISEYPSGLVENDILTVKGKSYPNSDVTVYVQKDEADPISQVVRTTDSGTFTFTVPEKVKNGIYKLWATVKRADGSVSGPGAKVNISVKAQVALVVGQKAIAFLTILVEIVALVVLVALMYMFMKKKIRSYKSRVLVDVEQTKIRVDDILKKMHENEIGIIQVLEKAMLTRQLTPEEEEILTRLRYESQEQVTIDKDLNALEEDVKR